MEERQALLKENGVKPEAGAADEEPPFISSSKFNAVAEHLQRLTQCAAPSASLFPCLHVQGSRPLSLGVCSRRLILSHRKSRL